MSEKNEEKKSVVRSNRELAAEQCVHRRQISKSRRRGWILKGALEASCDYHGAGNSTTYHAQYDRMGEMLTKSYTAPEPLTRKGPVHSDFKGPAPIVVETAS